MSNNVSKNFGFDSLPGSLSIAHTPGKYRPSPKSRFAAHFQRQKLGLIQHSALRAASPPRQSRVDDSSSQDGEAAEYRRPDPVFLAPSVPPNTGRRRKAQGIRADLSRAQPTPSRHARTVELFRGPPACADAGSKGPPPPREGHGDGAADAFARRRRTRSRSPAISKWKDPLYAHPDFRRSASGTIPKRAPVRPARDVSVQPGMSDAICPASSTGFALAPRSPAQSQQCLEVGNDGENTAEHEAGEKIEMCIDYAAPPCAEVLAPGTPFPGEGSSLEDDGLDSRDSNRTGFRRFPSTAEEREPLRHSFPPPARDINSSGLADAPPLNFGEEAEEVHSTHGVPLVLATDLNLYRNIMHHQAIVSAWLDGVVEQLPPYEPSWPPVPLPAPRRARSATPVRPRGGTDRSPFTSPLSRVAGWKRKIMPRLPKYRTNDSPKDCNKENIPPEHDPCNPVSRFSDSSSSSSSSSSSEWTTPPHHRPAPFSPTPPPPSPPPSPPSPPPHQFPLRSVPVPNSSKPLLPYSHSPTEYPPLDIQFRPSARIRRNSPPPLLKRLAPERKMVAPSPAESRGSEAGWEFDIYRDGEGGGDGCGDDCGEDSGDDGGHGGADDGDMGAALPDGVERFRGGRGRGRRLGRGRCSSFMDGDILPAALGGMAGADGSGDANLGRRASSGRPSY